MKVPFLDLAAAAAECKPDLEEAVLTVLASGRYLFGPQLEDFEREWAAYVGAHDSVGVGSGLDALYLALRAFDVGPGDEVIVPSHTFVATWLAVTMVGATIVPVEPELGSYVVTVSDIERLITPRTKAVIPVHLYGQPVDVAAITKFSADYGLVTIFDGAQAHARNSHSDEPGRSSVVTAWSFYPGKNLGGFGDGGAITGPDEALLRRIRRLRNYGSEQKYVHLEAGINSRLDEIQAAVLRVKLRRLDSWNARRQTFAARYLSGLAGTPLVLPRTTDSPGDVWHLFVVRTSRRDDLRAFLARRGIECGIHYPIPPHRQPMYSDMEWPALPVSEEYAATVLSLPMGPHLTDDQVEYIISSVRLWCSQL